MYNLTKEINELLEKYPDPRKADGWTEFVSKEESEICLPRFGTVVDK